MQNAINKNPQKTPTKTKQQKPPQKKQHERWLGYDLIDFFIFGVLMPLSAIFPLFHGDQF
jgi:hypothetical protein